MGRRRARHGDRRRYGHPAPLHRQPGHGRRLPGGFPARHRLCRRLRRLHDRHRPADDRSSHLAAVGRPLRHRCRPSLRASVPRRSRPRRSGASSTSPSTVRRPTRGSPSAPGQRGARRSSGSTTRARCREARPYTLDVDRGRLRITLEVDGGRYVALGSEAFTAISGPAQQATLEVPLVQTMLEAPADIPSAVTATIDWSCEAAPPP